MKSQLSEAVESVGQYAFAIVIAVLVFTSCDAQDKIKHERAMLEFQVSLTNRLSIESRTLEVTNQFLLGVNDPSVLDDWSRWRSIRATTSKPAIIRWGTNEIRIPAGSNIDITFEGKERK